MMRIEAVDLFCGAGGLAFGLQKAGIRVRAGYDIDSDCSFAFQQNIDAEFHLANVLKINGEDITSRFSRKSIRILAGCAPCQDYSHLTNKMDRRRRWRLVHKFADLVTSVEPDFVTMENVPALERTPEFARLLNCLDSTGYGFWHDIVDCSEHNVPQKRKRLVLIAGKNTSIPELPRSLVRKTVRQTIGGLPPLEAGGLDAKDPLHRTAALSYKNLMRIRKSVPGGNWHDWPESLKLGCHLRSTGASYTPVYGRMDWDEPAPTMTTRMYNYGSGRFGHPDQDRSISLREAAMLQSFPKRYRFAATAADMTFARMAKLIGNAVPPRLAEKIGRHIASIAGLRIHD